MKSLTISFAPKCVSYLFVLYPVRVKATFITKAVCQENKLLRLICVVQSRENRVGQVKQHVGPQLLLKAFILSNFKKKGVQLLCS